MWSAEDQASALQEQPFRKMLVITQGGLEEPKVPPKNLLFSCLRGEAAQTGEKKRFSVAIRPRLGYTPSNYKLTLRSCRCS